MKYVCSVCGYVYDDAVEAVPFDSLPADWECPLCHAPKAAFKPAEEPEDAAKDSGSGPVAMDPSDIPEDYAKLSVAQMAALCSNLARGCEKQYKTEEAAKFRELADWFTGAASPAEDASVIDIAAKLKEEIASYPSVDATAKAAADRGAQRACVWGEKVSVMLSSILDRYLKEYDGLLADTEIWVCTACGFVFIGNEPPEQCPVCKVPAWKFEKVERRA